MENNINKTSFKKHVGRIRKSHSWIVLVIFAVLSVIALILTVAFGSLIIDYIIESKVSSAAERVLLIADGYSRDPDALLRQLNDDESSYVIEDGNGEVIESGGVDSRGVRIFLLSLNDSYDEVEIYSDQQDDFIDVEDIDPDFSLNLSKSGYYKAFFGRETANYGTDNLFDVRYSFPLWIKSAVPQGSESVFVKTSIDITLGDNLLVLGFLIISGVFFFLTFVMLIVYVIVSMVNNKKNLSTFFRDHVTEGKNWNWFVFRGGKVVAMRRHRKDTFAVANIFFVNYRNFVLCHSVKEGEKMLKRVYEVIEATLEKDEIVVRSTMTGFALLLIYKDEESMRSRLSLVIKELEGIDSDHDFSFQIGVCVDSDGTENCRSDLETEYNNACAARETMEESTGSGIAFFNDKIREERVWYDIVTENQKAALDNKEFKVYYQPKFDPNDDTLKGAEALIRWQSPKFGLVSPGKFIPIFEKNGFITSIDHYMLVNVAKDQAAWLKAGYECVPVSVNVSRAHFIENDLADQIKDMIDAQGCPRNLVEIEVTESAFFDDKKALVAAIRKLRDYGFAVSMDDFGSGYSSLNSLKDMPLDVLKIDAEFFRGDNSEDRGRIVVSETIKLAKDLNMRTVAEGVETRELVDFLAQNGCDMIQGFYYAKPMPSDEYEKQMKANKNK